MLAEKVSVTPGWVSVDGHAHFGLYREDSPCGCGGKLLKQFDTDTKALEYEKSHPPKTNHSKLYKQNIRKVIGLDD